MKLKENNVYIVRLKHGTEEILEDLNIRIKRLIQYARSENIRDDDEKNACLSSGALFWLGGSNDQRRAVIILEIYSIYEKITMMMFQ